MIQKERARSPRAHSPNRKRSGAIIAGSVQVAGTEPSWDSADFAQAYDDAFYNECHLRNRGGLRNFFEARDRREAEIRARGLYPISTPDDVLAWIDDRRREHGDRPPLRALELTINGATLADACRLEGTTPRTVRKYLREHLAEWPQWRPQACSPRASQTETMSAETITLAISKHVRGTRRHARALRELQARFPAASIVEAERLDGRPDRLVFVAERNMLDEGVFRAIRDCDEAGVPVFMLDRCGRLIARDRLRLTTFEGSTPRSFAAVEVFRDRRVNPRAFA